MAVCLLKKMTTEESGPGRKRGPFTPARSSEQDREEEWPRMADGLIALYRRNAAIEMEMGVPHLSELGRKVLEASGVKAFVDAELKGMMEMMARKSPQNPDEVLRWAVAAFFETDPAAVLAGMQLMN